MTAEARAPREHARARATAVIVGVARFAHRPVIDARVTITIPDDAAPGRPAEVAGSLDVDVVRAYADRLADAFDRLDERLRRNLQRMREPRAKRRPR